MKLIIATNNLNVLGDQGSIPWKCKADMQHFKKLTSEYQAGGGFNPLLIMGSTTYASVGSKNLPNRVIIPVGRDYSTLPQAVRQAIYKQQEYGTPIWVCGGKQIYDQLIHICDEVHWSHINNDTPGDVTWTLPTNYRGKVFHYNFDDDGRTTTKTDQT